MIACAAKLVNAAVSADHGVIADGDVTGERGRVGEDVMRADMTIVRDVRLRHNQIVMAKRGQAAAASGAAMQGDEFTNRVALTNDQACALARVLEVLRRLADARERKNTRAA